MSAEEIDALCEEINARGSETISVDLPGTIEVEGGMVSNVELPNGWSSQVVDLDLDGQEEQREAFYAGELEPPDDHTAVVVVEGGRVVDVLNAPPGGYKLVDHDIPQDDILICADELAAVEGVTVSQVRSVEARIRLDTDDVGDIAQASDGALRSAAFDKMLPHLTAAGAEPATVDFEEIERHDDYAVVTQVRSLNVRTWLTPEDHSEVFQGDVTEDALQSTAFDEMMPHLVDAGIEPLTLDFQEFDVDFKRGEN
jgi:hypothetical protein